MSARLTAVQNNGPRLEWARMDPSLPGGLHLPKKRGDVGFDLEAMYDVTIGPMESADVAVNARIALPEGYYADVRNRSSMARRGLYVDQNLIDTGYRGQMFVFLRNMQLPSHQMGYFNGMHFVLTHPQDVPLGQKACNANAIRIHAGERIAQLVFHRVGPVWPVEMEEVDVATERGETGFGSTNIDVPLDGVARTGVKPGGIAGGVLDGTYDTPCG